MEADLERNAGMQGGARMGRDRTCLPISSRPPRSRSTRRAGQGKMKLRHLPPALFLLVLALSLTSYRRHLVVPPSQHRAGDAVLRRLAAVDAGGDQILADAAALLANASISSSQLTTNNHSLGNGHPHHRLLLVRLPCSSCPRRRQRTVYSLRVPPYGYGMIPDDGALLAAFRASLRSFLRVHQRRSNNVASVMRDLPGLLGRFRTCAVVGNSGILLGSGRGAQIDAHHMVIRLNNAPVAGGFARDVGARTSLTLAHSFVLHRCSTRSAATTPGCACHPYGRSVPLHMYVSRPEHLLDAVACGATATAASPFRLRLTDARLDALSARIAKYYSLRRFVAATGEPATAWARRRDNGRLHHFHYSSGMQAVLMALGACEEVSMFGFGKAATAKHHYHTDRDKETDVHDYEAEYEFYRDLQTRPEAVPFLDEAPPGFKVPPVKQYW